MEFGLALAPDGPIDITQVIVQYGVHRNELYRAFHLVYGLFVAAQPVKHPTKRIDDIPGVRAGCDGALNHVQRLVQIATLFDQRIP